MIFDRKPLRALLHRSSLEGGYFALWALLLTSMGCSLMKPDPAPDSGYIAQPEVMAPWKERAAFVQRIWFKNQKEHYATRDRFSKIHFRPTRTDYLSSPGWWDELNAAGREEYHRDALSMAEYLDQALSDVFTKDPSKRFVVTDTPDSNTIIYEFALVELRPTKVAVNAAGTALGALVPGGGIVKSTAKGSIAVEVTARDGSNEELLIAWADREIDQAAPFSFRDFAAYAHARKAARRWAEDLLEAWTTPDTHLIEGLSPVTIDPF